MVTTTGNSGGLNILQWAKWRKDVLIHGTYDPNESGKLNDYQRRWTQDLLNTMKSIESDTIPTWLQ